MENLRQKIESRQVPLRSSGATAHVTVSIGLATWPEDGDTLQETLATADDRLYRAKQTGRNRVVVKTEVDTVAVEVPANYLDE